MATRSTVTVVTPTESIHLYRHWDGGPWGNLATMLSLLANNPRIESEEFVKTLVNMKTGEDRHFVYEYTEFAENHSDREWHYVVSMMPEKETSIAIFERDYNALPVSSAFYSPMMVGKFIGSVEEALKWYTDWVNENIDKKYRQSMFDQIMNSSTTKIA